MRVKMMSEDDLNDDVMFRVSGAPEPEIFRPTAYHIYHSTDDDQSTSDEDRSVDTHDLTADQISKPLMPPRQRPIIRIKSQPAHTSLAVRIFWPLVYLFIFVASMAAFVCLIIYIVDVYMNKLLLAEKLHMKGSRDWENLTVIGCSNLSVEDVWVIGLPKVLTESAFRLVDVNQDGVLDIVLGFATGADKLKQDPLVCDIYFNGTKPCGGGIMALDGQTGDTLWEHRANHEIFSLNCQEDLDKDGIKDCIGGGRAGTFQAASGRDGRMLWVFNDSSLNAVMNAYTGQYVDDIDKDGVPDILNIHGGDPLGEPGSNTRLVGKLLLFSGRTGEVISWTEVPEARESYYSPVLYRRRDGTDYVLFGTGGETHSGALYIITLNDLKKRNINKAKKLFNDPFKGIMTPPVLVDLTRDGTEDIVFATFNSTVVAIDGETFSTLWNFSYPSSETYATPAAGFYNDDDIPDFIVRWQMGPGFPLYYHSIMTVLDGATGKPLITPYPRDSIGAQTSPLTLSMEGTGNDIFLYWISDCHGQEGKGGAFSFKKGTNVHEQSRADFCRLRFKTSGFSKMLGLSQHFKLPGQTVYNSEERYHTERSAWVNTTALAMRFLQTHPKNRRDYEQWKLWVAAQQDKWRLADEARKVALSDGIEYPTNGQQDYTEDTARTYEPLRKPQDWGVERDQGFNPNQDKSTYDEEESLREKITSIVTELLNKENSMEGGEDFDKPEGGLGRKGLPQREHSLQDISKRLKEEGVWGRFAEPSPDSRPDEPRSPYDPRSEGTMYERYPVYDAPNTERASVDNPRSGESSDRERSLHMTPENEDAENKRRYLQQKKSGRGVSEMKEEMRLEELRKKYMESFGRRKRHRRRKRHVGPHDEGGLQRLISTGTLVPPLLPKTHPDYAHSMDVVFATYWFYPAKTTILLPEDEQCLQAKMDKEKQRFDPKSHYYGMDHDAYEHATLDECLEQSGHIPETGTYESQSTYNPYDLHMGQMTVYRLRIKCNCGNKAALKSKGQRCARVLPHDRQQWSAYMGTNGDSHWIPRDDWGSSKTYPSPWR